MTQPPSPSSSTRPPPPPPPRGARRALPPPPEKGRKRTAIERRVDACNATMRKFQGKRFSFRLERDCARLVAFHLSKMGRPVQIAKAGKYADTAGALAALARLGASDLPSLMSQHFETIGHASALPGDVLQIPAEGDELTQIGCLVVFLGDGAVFGFHGETGRAEAMRLMVEPLGCWRVL